jgi:hypothetical protein
MFGQLREADLLVGQVGLAGEGFAAHRGVLSTNLFVMGEFEP